MLLPLFLLMLFWMSVDKVISLSNVLCEYVVMGAVVEWVNK